MDFGICNLNNIPLRLEPSHTSEMTSQILFGEHFSVLEINKNWLFVKLAFDGHKGWVDKDQVVAISKNEFKALQENKLFLLHELVNYASVDDKLMLLSIGATLPYYKKNRFVITHKEYQIDTKVRGYTPSKKQIIETAFMYLDAPYLWGGKTPFGIDCSGFTQMVYKLNGYKLFRTVDKQAIQGEALGFIEESEPGDLAFFDNEEGLITHVGIVLANNYIIHASGKVRLDRLDQSGIYNEETNRHTHKLRIIKKMY